MIAWVFAVMAAGVFELKSFPLETAESESFFAPLAKGQPAALFVTGKMNLRIYSPLHDNCWIIELPESVPVLDVADLDGDERTEILLIQGERILAQTITLEPNEDTLPPRELFSLVTPYTREEACVPKLQQLAVDWHGRTVLAIPTEDTIELRTADGTVIDRIKVEQSDPSREAGLPFSAWHLYPQQAAPPGSIEWQVTRVLRSEIKPHEGDKPTRETPAVRIRRAPASQMTLISEQGPESWPWFSLKTSGEARDRAYHAPSPPDYRDTLVVIRPEKVLAAPWGSEAEQMPPSRRYPGLPLLPEAVPPDFNHDGYSDLLLWSSPEAGVTIDSLMKIAARQLWPVRVAAHLYSVEKGRFEAVPDGVMECRIPVLWLLAMEDGFPFRHVVLEDLNGDGCTDCAWSTSESDFEVWLYEDTGFGKQPSYRHRFPEPIQEVSADGPVVDGAPSGIVLKGEKNGYWLYVPTKAMAAPRPLTVRE